MQLHIFYLYTLAYLLFHLYSILSMLLSRHHFFFFFFFLYLLRLLHCSLGNCWLYNILSIERIHSRNMSNVMYVDYCEERIFHIKKKTITKTLFSKKLWLWWIRDLIDVIFTYTNVELCEFNNLWFNMLYLIVMICLWVVE